MATFKDISAGDRIKFLISNGIGRNGIEWKSKTGRVVMAFEEHVVVNGGGRYGTPHVVDEGNFVAITRRNSQL